MAMKKSLEAERDRIRIKLPKLEAELSGIRTILLMAAMSAVWWITSVLNG